VKEHLAAIAPNSKGFVYTSAEVYKAYSRFSAILSRNFNTSTLCKLDKHYGPHYVHPQDEDLVGEKRRLTGETLQLRVDAAQALAKLDSNVQELDAQKRANGRLLQELDGHGSANETLRRELDAQKKANGMLQQELDRQERANETLRRELDGQKTAHNALQQELIRVRNTTRQKEKVKQKPAVALLRSTSF
jgi:hypothetical protein